MRYLDTSVIVKLYVREARTGEAVAFIESENSAVPLTRFHELEMANALRLKQFRGEAEADQVDTILERLRAHVENGVYFRPSIDWPALLHQAERLSHTHTARTGTRTLDVIHVASAVAIGADRFLTFDERQRTLAQRVGLKTDAPRH